jgi:hypothetical protein
MKMTRNILRRLEMKIYHAMIVEQSKKQTVTQELPKPGANKPVEDTVLSK